MAFSSDDIATLQTAIATGALQVRYADGRQVTYRSLPEMLQTLQIMKGDVEGSSGNSRSFVAGF
jgi:hypothetical protein